MNKKSKILIVCALKAEAKAVQEAFGDNLPSDVDVRTVGVGSIKSVKNTFSLIDRIRPLLIVNWGLAGALSDDWETGQCVEISEVVIDQAGEDQTDDRAPDPTALIRLPSQNLGWRRARLVSVPRPVKAGLERERLRQRTQASLVDMEGGFIGREAQMAEISFICLKTISDMANEETDRDFFGRYEHILIQAMPELRDALIRICRLKRE